MCLAADAAVRALISVGDGTIESVLYSDHMTKFNRHDLPQERILVVTSAAFYNLDKARKLKRRVPLAFITGVTASSSSHEFVLHVPSEWDYRVATPSKNAALGALALARKNDGLAPLEHKIVPEQTLEKFARVRMAGQGGSARGLRDFLRAALVGTSPPSSPVIEPQPSQLSYGTTFPRLVASDAAPAAAGVPQAEAASAAPPRPRSISQLIFKAWAQPAPQPPPPQPPARHSPPLVPADAAGSAPHLQPPEKVEAFISEADESGHGQVADNGGNGSLPWGALALRAGSWRPSDAPLPLMPTQAAPALVASWPRLRHDSDPHGARAASSLSEGDVALSSRTGTLSAAFLASCEDVRAAPQPPQLSSMSLQPSQRLLQPQQRRKNEASEIVTAPRGLSVNGPAAPPSSASNQQHVELRAAHAGSHASRGVNVQRCGREVIEEDGDAGSDDDAEEGCNKEDAADDVAVAPHPIAIEALVASGVGNVGSSPITAVNARPIPEGSPVLTARSTPSVAVSPSPSQLLRPARTGALSGIGAALAASSASSSPVLATTMAPADMAVITGAFAAPEEPAAPAAPSVPPPSSSSSAGAAAVTATGAAAAAAKSDASMMGNVTVDVDAAPEDSDALVSGSSVSSGALSDTLPIDLSHDRRSGRALRFSDFDLIRVVGKGSYGKVLLVRLRGPSGTAEGPLAMKVLSKAHVVARRQVEHTQAERVILEAVDHPFLQRLRFAFQQPEALFLVTRFLPGGELFHHLRAAGHFSEELTRFYAAEVALALHHLHSLDIVYRDLKVRVGSAAETWGA
jgi:hypothetical protein